MSTMSHLRDEYNPDTNGRGATVDQLALFAPQEQAIRAIETGIAVLGGPCPEAPDGLLVGLARRTDGPGSHEAAEAMRESGALNAQCELVLATVRAHPGLTAPEMERATGVSHYVLSRRLSDLLKRGLVCRDNAKCNHDLDRCAVSGVNAWRWWAK